MSREATGDRWTSAARDGRLWEHLEWEGTPGHDQLPMDEVAPALPFGLRHGPLVDCCLLEEGGLLDAAYYRQHANLDPTANVAEHYLTDGWRFGMEPTSTFEGTLLYPYFRSVGFAKPPAVTYLELRAAGWAVYPTLAEAESVAAVIRASEFFDAQEYAKALSDQRLDPALHYVIAGERMGHRPGPHFDPTYYGRRHPDVANAGICLLLHFIQCGQHEGRRSVSVASTLVCDRSRISPLRKTVLIVSHQASRTGAPILAYNIATRLRRQYNIITLLLAGGELVPAYQKCSTAVVGPLSQAEWHPVEFEYIVAKLLETYEIHYAVVNSIESRLMLEPLTLSLVPVVALVHEFPSLLRNTGEMGRALEWANRPVFSSRSVFEAVRDEYPNVENWNVHILPQGQSKLPPIANDDDRRRSEEAILNAMRPVSSENALVVLGCGTICPRKGVDLFFGCAAAVKAMGTKRPVRFVWIGQRLHPSLDADYYMLLTEQIRRSGLQDMVRMVDPVDDLDRAYSEADVFFLSSRLDPMPNVAIDAALAGMPVVTFENSGGMGELLVGGADTRSCVVPYLDVHKAGELIAKFADDESSRQQAAQSARRLAQATFDMDRYVRLIDEIGLDASLDMQHRRQDLKTIKSDPMFDMIGFLGEESEVTDRDGAICRFLARSAALGTCVVPTANFYYRRPCAGFHPQVYIHENARNYDIKRINPLAHFIRSGKPDGPWRHEVITPPVDHAPCATTLRVALHAHLYYPELADDLLQKLAPNRSKCDLFLSTTSDAKIRQLEKAMASYEKGTVTIQLVPNRGRDICPFLTCFAKNLAGYDVIGHVHSKRSLFTGSFLGERWREFLWEHLLGNLYPMMDLVLKRLEEDESVGLAFPDDPHLPDWDKNMTMAEALVQRIGIKEPLPRYFNFPVGTMFWARTKALKPLFDLKLGWQDFPEEPLPIDGTILHALERVIPFVARHAGYRYVTTHIPGITW